MSRGGLLCVLLNWRTPDMTLRAAEAALRDMDGMGDKTGHLVIVDNCSGDGSFARLDAAVRDRGWDVDGRVRVVQSGRNGGFGAGNNFGIRAARASGLDPEFIYILNSDAFPDPGCIGALTDFLRAHPKAGFAGSHVRGEDGVAHCTCFRFPSVASEFEGAVRTGLVTRLLKRHVVPLEIPAVATRVGWVAGASLMARAATLDEVGLFDERFFLYFEETELARRAACAGWETWYVPESRVVHVGSVSTGMKTWARMPQYWFDSRLHYFTKSHGAVQAAAATAALIAGASLWRLRCALGGRAVGGPDGFLRDLIAHSARAALGGRGSAGPTPSFSKEMK